MGPWHRAYMISPLNAFRQAVNRQFQSRKASTMKLNLLILCLVLGLGCDDVGGMARVSPALAAAAHFPWPLVAWRGATGLGLGLGCPRRALPRWRRDCRHRRKAC